MSTAPSNLDPFAMLGAAVPGTPRTPTGTEGVGAARVAADLPEVLSGANALAVAANPLLNLIPQIRVTAQHPDPAGLRNYLVEQIQLFERRAREAQVAPETILAARYVLCTALDETAAKTPWGGGGQWSRHSLLVTFHNETWGGEKAFQVLARLVQDPKRHIDLIEMTATCIALGFEGRFSVIDNGRSQLETLRRRLVEIIQSTRGEYSHALSEHWRGAEADLRRDWGLTPVWATAGVLALLLTGVFFLYYFLISERSSAVYAAINAIRPQQVIAAKPVPVETRRLAKFLEPEIREGLVYVNDFADRSIVVLRGDGMFDSGSADVKERYLAVIERVAKALEQVPGAVMVVGHTDDVPIRGLRRYPSNYELSQARAEAVKAMVDARLSQRDRTRSQGKADAEPIAPNTNPEGRAQNRRVEVTLVLPPEVRDQELNSAGRKP